MLPGTVFRAVESLSIVRSLSWVCCTFGSGSQFRGFLQLEETQGRVAQQPSRASTLAHIILSAPVPGPAARVRPRSLAPCPS